MAKCHHTPLRTSKQDIEQARQVPVTPQTQAPAYKLAFSDEEFMTSQEMRGIRFQLEYQKPELWLREREVNSTIVLFGGARIAEPGTDPWAAKTAIAKKNLIKSSKYYDEARLFAQYASITSKLMDYKEYMVVTGGGPGVMEAGNRGAHEVGAPSIGLNIVLPHEQAPNAYVSPEFCFNFHYFATRKIHFLLRAKAVAVFPGGFGTLDEFFETLTLIQTGRMQRVPVILFGGEFWGRVINIEALVEEGTVSPEDVDLFTIVDNAHDGWQIIRKFYDLPEVSLDQATPEKE